MITTISNTNLSARICHKGAELISLQKNDSQREYIWDGNPKYWGKHSPILFPIVGTLKNNQYHYEGKQYELMRHGFARDLEFSLISFAQNEAVFSLLSDESTMQNFPFKFELQVTYLIKDNGLSVIYKIINKDTKTIPYSIGGHPAFALNDNFENFSLEFEDDVMLTSYQLETDLLSEKNNQINIANKLLPLTYSLFENDALILKTLRSKQIQILENNSPILNFKFYNFPNFGIWTKKNASFICLEPWAGYSDTLESTGNIMEKEGIQKLGSNESIEYKFTIEIL